MISLDILALPKDANAPREQTMQPREPINADGVIKDCVRIYATENAQNTIAIDNTSYALIERKDIVEMFVKYNAENETSEGKALVIKRPKNFSSDEEVVGLIFPTDYEE